MAIAYRKIPNTNGLFEVYISETGGPVPDMLKGSYTSERLVKQDIEAYLNAKEEKIKQQTPKRRANS